MSNASFFGSSPGTTTSGVVRAAPSRLMKGFVTNANASPRYLQLFDAVAVPQAGSVPTISVPLDPGTAQSVSREFLDKWLPDGGLWFGTGLCWAISSALATLDQTGVNASEHSVVIPGGDR